MNPDDHDEWWTTPNTLANEAIAALTAAGYSIVRRDELAGLRAIEEAARDYDPEREHSWRCEYRTAEAGWTAGEPPVIRCECGHDALRAALEKGTRP